MHILLIHQAFATVNEPGGTRHHEMAKYLAERGHQVTVIASPVSYLTGTVQAKSKSEDQTSTEGDVKILCTYTYPALHRSFVHRVFSFLSFMLSSFWRGLRVKDVDLVWGTSPPIFQGLTAWVLSRLKGASFLFEVRDLWPAFAIQVGVLRNPFLIDASLWLERLLYRHADLVVVNSPGFIAHVSTHGAKRVELVPNGSDTVMFNPDFKGESFRQHHALEGKFIALYAGAHGMSNDLDVLLQSAEILADYPEITFVLLGDGKEKSALQEKAKRMNLDNVRFIAPIPKTRMPEALAAADICIAILKPVPLYATVFPNKVFDYMAAGRPVVLAIDGVIRKLIENAEAGIYVTPGDPRAMATAILKLHKDPQLCMQLGANGRSLVNNEYDRYTLSVQMAEIMESLMAERGLNRKARGV